MTFGIHVYARVIDNHNVWIFGLLALMVAMSSKFLEFDSDWAQRKPHEGRYGKVHALTIHLRL